MGFGASMSQIYLTEAGKKAFSRNTTRQRAFKLTTQDSRCLTKRFLREPTLFAFMNSLQSLHTLRKADDAAGFAMRESERAIRGWPRATITEPPQRRDRLSDYSRPRGNSPRRCPRSWMVAPCARVLQPSAGLGRGCWMLYAQARQESCAVEMATECAGELYRQDRPNVTILQRDFLSVTVAMK